MPPRVTPPRDRWTDLLREVLPLPAVSLPGGGIVSVRRLLLASAAVGLALVVLPGAWLPGSGRPGLGPVLGVVVGLAAPASLLEPLWQRLTGGPHHAGFLPTAFMATLGLSAVADVVLGPAFELVGTLDRLALAALVSVPLATHALTLDVLADPDPVHPDDGPVPDVDPGRPDR